MRHSIAPIIIILFLLLNVQLPVQGQTLSDLPSNQPTTQESSNAQSTLAPTVRLEDNDMFLSYSFNYPQTHSVDLANDSSYVSVTIEGCFQYGSVGCPVLPYRTAKIAIPEGKAVESISVSAEDFTVLPGAYKVEYATQSLPITDDDIPDPQPPTQPNLAAYSSEIELPGILRGNFSIQHKMGVQIVLLDLYPLQYLPITGQLTFYQSLQVHIQLSAYDDNAPTSLLRAQQYDAVRTEVDNPDIILGLSGIEPLTTYQYVIITNQLLANTPGPNNFQALRDDKISRGISATIVTVEWIFANYNGARPDGGADNQTKIRNFIIDAYNNWGTVYVLLGGDGDGGNVGGESGNCIIPHRGFKALDDTDIPADMYYACLDGTFDYNGNGIYGEPTDGLNGGEIDLFSEVYVGRACADSQTEVQNFVRKTLSYQTTAAADLKKVLMAGEQLDSSTWGGAYKDQILYGSSDAGYTTKGFLNSAYAQDLSFSRLYDSSSGSWTKNDIVNAINSNVNLINHLGHSNVNYGMRMYDSDVDSVLTNERTFFIGYSQGCYAGAFDDRSTTAGTYTSYDCIAEHLTTSAHGAVAFVANSRYGWYRPSGTDSSSQHFDRQFWDAILGENILNVGKANQDSKEDNAGRVIANPYDRWVCYELNLFGDPELKVRFPSEQHNLDISLGCPTYLNLGQSTLLTATVFNRGLETETQVTVNFNVNGLTVHQETISSLARGANYTTSFFWTPTFEAMYNVTAYVQPVQGEDNTIDNTQSAAVLVNAASILLVNDNDGAFSIDGTSLSILSSTLTAQHYSFLVWNESLWGNPPFSVLSNFGLVIWTSGDYWGTAVDSTDAINLEAYVAQGGNLLLEGEDIGLSHGTDDFMKNVAHAVYQVDKTNAVGLSVTKPNHPVAAGLPSTINWIVNPPYDDGVTPTNTGMEVIQYTGTSFTAVTTFESDISRVVYIAFPLRCLGTSPRDTLVINSINWLTAHPANLTWTQEKRICDEPTLSESNPSIATDSNGNFYLAYEHYNTNSQAKDLIVSKSTNKGITWSTLCTLSWGSNLEHPSIAVDIGDNNNLYIAFEREWTTTDHDIFVLKFVGGVWSVSAVSNYAGSDDRFPSLTCEFQYGTSDRLYISYELVYSNDDRDLMFAKSLDDGATWSLQTLHGTWPDGNVHCQSSITTTRGSDGNDWIYIAYKWGADYNTAYDIVIDKSKDRGATWTQQKVCDESSRDKNWPCIVSTRGGGVVFIAWQVYWDSTYLNDIQDAFSEDNGNSWYTGWLAMDIGVNEQTPALAVDGQDSTNVLTRGNIYAGYWKSGSTYFRHADSSTPWLWSSPERISYTSSFYTKPTVTAYRNTTGRYLPALAWINSNSGLYFSAKNLEPSIPTGSVIINSGDAYTTIPSVTLTLTYADTGSGVSQVRYSNDNSTWSNWEGASASKAWSLTSGDGTKTIYYQIKNNGGWISSAYSDSIILDTTAPTGSVLINSGNAYSTSTSVTLTLASSDSTSGVGYVRYSNDCVTWTDWESPETTKTWTLASGDDIKIMYYQIKDNAGLLSEIYSDTINLDTTSPTGSITINNGDSYVTSASVTLTLTYLDSSSGVSQVRYSNDGSSWGTWETASVSKAWTLTSGDGTKTVYYQIRDNSGLISETYTGSILLDMTAPTGSITINNGDASTTSTSITLSLIYSDSGSGVSQVRYSNDGVSWSDWESASDSKSWTLLSGEGTKTVYYQIKDNVGLMSSSFTDIIILQTPSSTPTPTPPPSPSQTSPTAAPTQKPSSTTPRPSASISPEPTSSPSVPELSWLVILPLLLAGFSVAVLFRHRKTSISAESGKSKE